MHGVASTRSTPVSFATRVTVHGSINTLGSVATAWYCRVSPARFRLQALRNGELVGTERAVVGEPALVIERVRLHH
jgi:hypothetical protein